MGKVKQKNISAIFLLGIYLALLIMPYYPYIYYYVYTSLSKIFETSIQANHQDTLIGDICYLSAITQRAGDKDAQSEVPPPPPVESSSGMVYLTPTHFSLSQITPFHTIHFKRYMISIKETFLEIQVPPPRKC